MARALSRGIVALLLVLAFTASARSAAPSAAAVDSTCEVIAGYARNKPRVTEARLMEAAKAVVGRLQRLQPPPGRSFAV